VPCPFHPSVTCLGFPRGTILDARHRVRHSIKTGPTKTTSLPMESRVVAHLFPKRSRDAHQLSRKIVRVMKACKRCSAHGAWEIIQATRFRNQSR